MDFSSVKPLGGFFSRTKLKIQIEFKQHRKNVHKLYDRIRADNLNVEEEGFHKIHTLNTIEI